MAHLAESSGLRIDRLFRAGGREGNLGLYAVMRR
jgi:hypothetical protein